MKKITLDNRQINRLINHSCIYLDNNNILQFVDDKLVLNQNGNIYYTVDINIRFQKRQIENEFIISDIKKLVCQHLNLEFSEVIYSTSCNGNFDFYVRFDAKNQWKIVVCDFATAVNNTIQILDEKIDFKCDAEVIGLYRKLGNSPYYFRWFNDIY